jgi:hypothetical protein
MSVDFPPWKSALKDGYEAALGAIFRVFWVL